MATVAVFPVRLSVVAANSNIKSSVYLITVSSAFVITFRFKAFWSLSLNASYELKIKAKILV